MRPQIEPSNVLTSETATFATATYDGQVSRVYVDGRDVGRANLQARDRVFTYLADAGLPVSTAICSFGFVIVGLAIFKPQRKGHAWIVGLAGGVAGAAALIGTGGVTALPQFAVWCPLVGATCGIAVLYGCSDQSYT